MLAVINSQTDIALTLLSLGAHPETVNKLNLTPLQIATCDNNIRLMLQLIKRGALVDSATMSCRWTPLHMAAALNRSMALSVLIRYDANVNAKDSDGDTPLIAACSLGHIDCVQQLLAGGGDPKIRTNVSSSGIPHPINYLCSR